MMKKDGKDIYTFTGLINRMEACRYRNYRFTEKDIPEEVEFKGTKFILTNDKTAYVNPENGESLAETVAVYYGGDLNKYLTEHEFIVTLKEKIFLTSEEKEFLRMCNVFLNGGIGIECIGISTDILDKVICVRFKDDTGFYIPIGKNAFKGVPMEKDYSLSSLGVYD